MCISGGLDGWDWKELKALPARWFDSLASVFHLFESEEVWPEKLLDECKVMMVEMPHLLVNDCLTSCMLFIFSVH